MFLIIACCGLVWQYVVFWKFAGNSEEFAHLWCCGRNLILNPFHIDRLKAKVTTFLWGTQEMYFSNYVVKFTRWFRRALELLLMITLITWWFIYKCYTITHDDQLLIMHFVRLKNLFCSFQNCSTLGDRAFAHAAPVLWDLLPLTIRFPFKKTFNLLE